MGTAFRLVHRWGSRKLNSTPEQADQYATWIGRRLPTGDRGGGRQGQMLLPNGTRRTLYQLVNYVNSFVPFG